MPGRTMSSANSGYRIAAPELQQCRISGRMPTPSMALSISMKRLYCSFVNETSSSARLSATQKCMKTPSMCRCGSAAACSCKDKCEAGAVNTACAVCKNNMTECMGKEKVTEKTPEPDPTPDTTDSPDKDGGEKKSGSGLVVIVLLLLMAGGGALYWFKFRKKKPDTKGPVDLDDYDYGDDEDEEYENEDDADEPEETEDADA